MSVLFTWNDGADSITFECVTQYNHDHSATPTENAVERGAPVTDHVNASNPTFSFEAMISNEPIRPGSYGGSYRSVQIQIPTVTQVEDSKEITPPKTHTLPGPLNVGAIVRDVVNELTSGSFTFKGLKPSFTLPTLDARLLVFDQEFDLRRTFFETLEKLRIDATIITVTTPMVEYRNCVLTKLAPSRSKDTGSGAKFNIEVKQISIVQTELVPPPKPTEPRAKSTNAKGTKAGEPVKQSFLQVLVNKTGANI